MILTIVLYFVVGSINAFMDKIQFHWGRFRFNYLSFLNPATPWKNKWKDGIKSHGERFPFSSSVLVFLTDGWHFSKWLMFTSIEFLISYHYNTKWYYIVLGIVLLKIVRGLGFTLNFDLFLNKNTTAKQIISPAENLIKNLRLAYYTNNYCNSVTWQHVEFICSKHGINPDIIRIDQKVFNEIERLGRLDLYITDGKEKPATA